MSCNLISDNEIDFILSALCLYNKSNFAYFGEESIKIKEGNFYFVPQLRDNLNKIGQALKDKNYESVNTRYTEKNECQKYEFLARHTLSRGALQALKLLDYYEYQTCEAPHFYESTEYKFINRLRKVFIAALPQYDECYWGFN